MRILFLQKRILFPADNGAKLRTLTVLKHLARWHEITYVCSLQLDEEQFVPPMRDVGLDLHTVPWRETSRSSPRFYGELALNLLSAYPYNVAKDYDRRLRHCACQLLERSRFDLVICDFVQMARNAIGLSGPPKILFQHNVEAEVFERQAAIGGSWLRRRYMAIQARKMRRFEGDAGSQFDAVIAVSQRDKLAFERRYGWRHVRVIDTAVDTEYFRTSGRPEVPDRIVFVGEMDWLPNVDGAQWFVKEIWPQVRFARPDATCQIVGRNPCVEVKRLAKTTGVEVTGTVPDVRPYLEQAAVVVVPLRVGGGTRLKIFEAMAMGRPVVSTTLGAEGLGVVPDRHIQLADSATAFAAKLVDALVDPGRRAALGLEGQRLVENNYSAETVARQFEDICYQTIKRPRAAVA